MILRRIATATAAAALATALIAPAATAAPTNTHHQKLGNRSLAAVLTAGGVGFDKNWNDYDILTDAVLTVIAAKPDSPVTVLTDGKTPVTAFLPNDRAFQILVKDLTGKWMGSEKAVFNAVAGLGVDTVEAVLLYHVIPGVTLTAKQAMAANGAVLNTALAGATVKVRSFSRYVPIIELKDNDPNDVNPFVDPRALDINKGNKQIAHGLLFVLRPVDL